jgi:hypothetical protein
VLQRMDEVVTLFIGPRREWNRRPAGCGGCAFNGGCPLRGGEREAISTVFQEGEVMGR